MRICRIQRRLPGLDIRLRTRDPPRPLKCLPESIERKVDRDPHISGDEAVLIERAKDVEAVEKSDDGKKDEGEVRGVGLKGRSEGEGLAIDSLGFKRCVKADIGDRNRHPGEEGGDGDKVLKPCEDDVGARRAGHVGEERDRGGDGNAVIWDTPVHLI